MVTPCNCSNKKEKIFKKCPVCKELSDNIHYMQVKPVVKKEVEKLVQEEMYYICKNDNCDVVFFNDPQDIIFLTRDINMTADFNEGLPAGDSPCGKDGCSGCHGKCR